MTVKSWTKVKDLGKTAPRGGAAYGPRKPFPHWGSSILSSSRTDLAKIWQPPCPLERQMHFRELLSRKKLLCFWGTNFLGSIPIAYCLDRKQFLAIAKNSIWINQVVCSRYFVHTIYLNLRLKSYWIHLCGVFLFFGLFFWGGGEAGGRGKTTSTM